MWEFWIPLILGSSVLAACIAFALESTRLHLKEIKEHNDNIKAIYNELKMIRETLERKDLRDIINHNVNILFAIPNSDHLEPKIAGKVEFKTLRDLQTIRERIYQIRKVKDIKSFIGSEKWVERKKETFECINVVLDDLTGETKGIICKPKLE